MAGFFVLRLPNCSLRSFSVSATSNGAPPSAKEGRIGPGIVELPLEKIRRPLMRTRDNDPIKVKDLMDSIDQIGLQVPIDVLEVDGVYYGFSGCHRYEAHQRLGLPTILCKVRKGTKETLRFILTPSIPSNGRLFTSAFIEAAPPPLKGRIMNTEFKGSPS